MKKSSEQNIANPFQLGEIELSAPTTPAQKEIWSSIEIDPKANICFNESISIDLNGDLSVNRLKEALDQFIQRHDAFRSCFTPNGKHFIVYHKPTLNLNYYDLSLEKNSHTQIDNLKKSATEISFDLVNGPLYQFDLVKNSETNFVLIITAHHLICDGWSMAVLVNEISSLYEGKKLEDAQQFCDFSLAFSKKSLEKDLNYWLDELNSSPNGLELPIDYNRPEFRTYESDRIDYLLNKELVQDIQKIAAKNRLSFYHFLFAGFNVFMHKLTQQNDLVIGISSALQSNYGKYDLVGHLVQLLPIRSQISNDITFSDFAKTIKKKMLDATEHSDITFGDIVQNLVIDRSPDKIPLMNVIFNVDQQYENQGFEFNEISASYESNPRVCENFEIFVNATTLKDKCVLECQYNKNLFAKETIQKWLVEFENLLYHFIKIDSEISSYAIKNQIISNHSKDNHVKKNEEQIDLVDVDENTVKSIVVMWNDVLKRNDIEYNSNFFQVGGHSLLAMDLVQLFKNDFDCKISIKDIMLNPTPLKLAHKIGSLNKVEVTERKNVVLDTKFNLSFSQKQTWFLQELNPDSNMFNLPSSILVKTPIDSDRLCFAYREILEKHSMLRTVFVKGPAQKILSTDEVLSQISFLPVEMNLEQAKEDMHQLAHQAIDIYKTPLFQFKLYKIAADEFIIYNNFHHILFDGWCFDIFFSDLNKAYLKQEISTETRTYQEFVIEQEKKINDDKFKSRLNEFCHEIESKSLESFYPADFNRPPVIDHSAKTLSFEFDSALIEKLNDFTKRSNTSLYNLFLSSFGLALMEGTKKDEILIGTPLRARPDRSDMNTIGYFVNSLPVIIEKKENNLNTLLNTQKEALKTIDYEDIPLELIIQKLKLKRDTSKTAIFQNFFSFQDVNNREGLFNNIPYSQVNIHKSTTHTDIDMWIKARANKIEGAIEFRVDLFKTQTIEKLKDRFFEILSETIFETEKTTPKNTTVVEEEFSFDKPIYLYVEEFAINTPHSLAFENSDINLSYEQLNKRANQYARLFASKGIKSGDLVGLCAHRDQNMIISLIALMKLGAGYVPLDPYFPDERLHYMIQHSEINSIILHNDLADRFKEMNVDFISFDNMKLEEFSDENLNYIHDEDATLYVIYTSGSTGKPKGVELGWRSVKNFVHSMQSKLRSTNKTKLLAVTTLSFDIAVLELYLPLISGGTLVLANKFESIDGEELNNLIQSKNVNMMQATPATWRLLLNADFNPLTNFTVLCGGEPFPLDLAQKLLSKNLEVWNMYGPTETTVWSTMKKLTMPLNNITIGNAIHNTQIYIMDDNLNELAPGEVGELCIAGEGLAKGYFKRDDLTEKVFIWNDKLKTTLYKTGDLAKIDNNSEIVCLGRNDSQVKIRGYRIELGEIETRISQHNDVEIAAVIVKEYSETDKRLIAFYSTSSDLEELDIREFLKDKIPSYMIPNQFIKMNDLPLTLNGKIDKKKLKADLDSSHNKQTSNPSSAKEKLELIWKDLLGVDQVDLKDDFFEVGGHSLLAVELFSRLEKEFSLELKLNQLINNSQFAGILELVDTKNDPIKKNTELKIPSLCECLVPIEINDPNKFLFCFHGVGGNILNYRVLQGNVGNHTLIGVQSIGVNGNNLMPKTMDEMVDRYIEEMKQIQSKGPYLLAGGSMGGTIALAVAQKLLESGDTVQSVIMFDTFGPNLKVKVYTEDSLLKRIKDAFIWRARKYYSNTFLFFFRLFGLKIPHSLRYFDIEVQNYKILHNHKVTQYNKRVDLIRAPKIEKTSYMDSHLGWSDILLGEFNIYEIEGHHEYFVEAKDLPNVVNSIMSDFS